VDNNCIKIVRNVEKFDSLTDGFVKKKCMNTCTEHLCSYKILYEHLYSNMHMSTNITLPPQEQFLLAKYRHVDTVISNVILQKDTRGSFRQWDKDDYDLEVTILQKTHDFGGYGMTPNVIAQTSVKDSRLS